MPKMGICDRCGTPKLLGYMACTNKWLCPDCAARILRANSQEIKGVLSGKDITREQLE